MCNPGLKCFSGVNPRTWVVGGFLSKNVLFTKGKWELWYEAFKVNPAHMWLHFSSVWKRRTPRNEQWLDRWHKPILYSAGWWHLYYWSKEDRVPYPGGAWAERPLGSTVSPWVFTFQHPWFKASSHARRKTQSSPSLCGRIQLACQGIFERRTKHHIFSLAPCYNMESTTCKV